jgi:hypothetical protein
MNVPANAEAREVLSEELGVPGLGLQEDEEEEKQEARHRLALMNGPWGKGTAREHLR